MKRIGHRTNSGFALIGSLLLLMLLSAIVVGVVYLVNSEARVGTSDLENNLAYYGAESAMEKMTADLSALYAAQQSPKVADIQALGNLQPNLAGIKYSNYQFDVPNVAGVPISQVRNISSGPNEGLVAQIVPLTLEATADRPSGAEARIVRNVEVALIPVFQFGIFSDSDLSFFPGPGFDFGGRTHTNGNLFLASGSAQGLTFHSRTTAGKDIIRQVLSNNVATTNFNHDQAVFLPTSTAGCDGAKPACRDLQLNEGSKMLGPTSADNPNWTTIANTYNGNLIKGAKPLVLPFVAAGVSNAEILRRPPPGEDPASAVGVSRLYNQATIRILLSDDPAELPGGAGDAGNIRLSNVDQGALLYSNGVPVPGASNTYFAEGKKNEPGENGWVTPPGQNTWPLLGGYLRVDIRQANGATKAVTKEWLELGFARSLVTPNSEFGVANAVHPNAILILQEQADRNGNGTLTGPNDVTAGETAAVVGVKHNWYPINMYDTREGEVRDTAQPNCALGGVMNLLEIDVRNLRRWLTGAIGVSGPSVDFASNSGYAIYFSDRRGMLPPGPGLPKTGEYGFEDNINPGSGSGLPDNILEQGEDVNQNGTLETYGAANLGDGFGVANGNPTLRVTCMTTARKNRVSGARHALRLENGSLGNLPVTPDGAGGFTVGSENPVYVKGDYNATNAGFGDPHAAAAVIADAVTLLSSSWVDLNSFNNPTSPAGRQAATTSYRMAVAAGKNLSFSSVVQGSSGDFGTDGGVHNFLRYLENWGGQTLNYRGSLVSLYYSAYGNGAYKCCNTVYNPPTRGYAFDMEFLDPSKLPPATPRFRDIDNTSAHQDFTPR